MVDSEAGEQRDRPRTALALKVEYPTLDGFLQDYEDNIRHGGTMIRTRRDVAVGDELRLAVSFPRLLQPIALEGVVQWAQPPVDGEQAFGVEFSRQPEGGWMMLAELVPRLAARDERLFGARTPQILVADDNEHIAEMICRGLQARLRRGSAPGPTCQAQRVANGVDALSWLEAQDCDLLLVDVMLPLIDGVELVGRVRADPRWQRLPIVAFSASLEADLAQRVIDAGADAFIAKPFRLADLLDTVDRLLES
ncbi:MAG: response regulator [Proteobacteria bacterium]|nr:response regulator [Pseudomonadota bacterium]